MKKRDSRLLLFIAVPVLIIGMGILIFQVFLRGAVTSYIENLMEEKIAIKLEQTSGDSLHVNIQKLEFNAFPITVSTPDISIYAATDVDNGGDSVMLHTEVQEAGVINLEISLKPLVLFALGQKKLNVNIFQADSVYFSTKHLSKETEAGANVRQAFHIGPIRFKGKIVLPDDKNTDNESIAFEEHLFQAAGIYAYMPQNLKSFQIDSISFDGTMETLSMEKIKMLPIHPKEYFYRYVEFETDRIEVIMDKMEINGFRIQQKDDRRGLMISQVNMTNGVIDVFRDRRPPFNEEQRPAMPARLILSAPIDLFIAEINISETDILYSEFPEDGSDSGYPEAAGNLSFNRLEASLRNITNISDSLGQDSMMVINAQAFIFDDAMLKADFRYNLKDINGGYTGDVELAEFLFDIINPAIYPLAGIEISEGTHTSSVFSFAGNDTETNGELYMKWNDLLLNITPDAGVFITGITESLGKSIYHPSSSEEANNGPSGEIYFERDIKRFVFHYWWNCYLSGIKNSVLRDLVPL